MRIFPILLLCMSLFFACKNDNSTATKTTAVQSETPAPTVAPAATQAAQKAGKASASTAQNLSTGYWHIGGTVNTDKKGKGGYDGEWFQFNKDQSFIYGKDTQQIATGTWIFDETNEYITFKGKAGEEAYYLYEFQCKQVGDIILLLGNTPNNPRGMQIKLVRQDTKVIEHNPN